jgi:hypothetical protein
MVTDLAPAVAGGLALMTVCFPLTHAMRAADLPPVLILPTIGTLGLLIHCAVVRQFFPATWNDLSSLAKRVLPSRTRSTPSSPTPPAPSAPVAINA